MTDKQAVIDVLNAMPENNSLEEIIEELHVMIAVRRGRAAIAAGRFKTQEEVRLLVDSWSARFPTRT